MHPQALDVESSESPLPRQPAKCFPLLFSFAFLLVAVATVENTRQQHSKRRERERQGLVCQSRVSEHFLEMFVVLPPKE